MRGTLSALSCGVSGTITSVITPSKSQFSWKRLRRWRGARFTLGMHSMALGQRTYGRWVWTAASNWLEGSVRFAWGWWGEDVNDF